MAASTANSPTATSDEDLSNNDVAILKKDEVVEEPAEMLDVVQDLQPRVGGVGPSTNNNIIPATRQASTASSVKSPLSASQAQAQAQALGHISGVSMAGSTVSAKAKPVVAVVPLNDNTNTQDAKSPSASTPPLLQKKRTSFDIVTDPALPATKGSSPSIGRAPSYVKSPSVLDAVPFSPTSQTDNPQENISMSESTTSKRRQKSEREVLVGTPVKEGHVNYMLMYDMLTGIRISVSRCYAKPHREVADEDFLAAHKLAFDVTGNELTPSSKYDFKFKDYCPWVFRLIRQEFHVDPSYYLLSLTGKYVLSELVSSGKSGSFFYYSQDYRFIIKTIHHSEHKFILKILRLYYEHIKSNPHTLLSRIFGLHRVKLPGNKKIHFVVMGNVFPANKDIHEVFDLKGSLFGRKISDQEAQSNPRAVMKDLNWLEKKKKLLLGPQKRTLFEKQMEMDVSFLMAQGIMDYSLLIGIHDVGRGNQDHIRDQTLSVFEPNTDVLARRTNTMSRKTKTQLFNAEAKNDVVQLGPSTSKLPIIIPPERRYCIFYSDEGGFCASDANDLPLPEIYYLGIIDISTFYSPAKKLETVFRSIRRKKELISAVDPIMYGNRFKKFMMEAIHDVAAAASEELIKQVKQVLSVPSGSYVVLSQSSP